MKKTLITICILTLLFSSSFAQIFENEEIQNEPQIEAESEAEIALPVEINTEKESAAQQDPRADAIRDAKKSKSPVIWGASSALASCLLAGGATLGTNYLLRNTQISVNIYTISAVCCLGTTLLSYAVTPKAPVKNLEGKDAEYSNKYQEEYGFSLKSKNAMYSFVGGVVGFLGTTLIAIFIIASLIASW